MTRVVTEYLPGWNWQRRGDTVEFSMEIANAAEIRNLAVVQALETIRNRIDEFGVAEPLIQRQGLEGDRIVVQLPGVDDPERVKKLIKNTAFLEFRMVTFPLGGGGVGSREQILANYGGQLPAGVEILTGNIEDDQGAILGQQFYAVEDRPVITGRDLRTARPGLGEFNQPVVNFYLTHEGGKLFAEATGNNVGKGLAVVLDGKVATAPNIRSRICGLRHHRGQLSPARRWRIFPPSCARVLCRLVSPISKREPSAPPWGRIPSTGV